MIRAILYDLDGVLVHACDWHYDAFNKALLDIANYSIPYDIHISTFNGIPTKEKLKILQEQRIIDTSQFDSIFEAKQRFTEEIINATATPYIEKIELHEYTNGLNKISACVTNSIRKTATLMLEKTLQLRYMKIVVSNEDVIKGKPQPDPYIFAMKRLSVCPVETLIIEDSDVGYRSAIESGANVRRVSECCQVNKGNVVKWLQEIQG